MPGLFYNRKLIQNLLERRRMKRVEFILSLVNTFHEMSILDVGCGPNGRSFENYIDKDYKITGIDILDEDKVRMSHPNFKYFKRDAQDLSVFRDDEFDLAVSFGMMEHICDHRLLNKMYSEINRVAKQWVIVVPWKYAFIEPHFKFPFFQLLPYEIQLYLVRVLNLHNLKETVKKDKYFIKNHYQWLSSSEWLRIYKNAKCYVTPYFDTIALLKSMSI